MLMHHPDATSISWGGTTFEPDERGVFDVPDEATADLAAFGLQTYVEPAPVPPPPQIKPVPQWSNDDLKAKAAELELNVEGLDRPSLIQAVTAALKAPAQT